MNSYQALLSNIPIFHDHLQKLHFNAVVKKNVPWFGVDRDRKVNRDRKGTKIVDFEN